MQLDVPPTVMQLSMLGQAAALVTMQLAEGEEGGRINPETTTPMVEEFTESEDEMFGGGVGLQVKARKILSVKWSASGEVPVTLPASPMQRTFQQRRPLSDTEYPDQYAAEESYAAQARKHADASKALFLEAEKHADASKAPSVEAKEHANTSGSPVVEAQKTHKTMLDQWLASPTTKRPLPVLQEALPTDQVASPAVGEEGRPVTGRKKRRKRKKEQEKKLALDEERQQQGMQAAPTAVAEKEHLVVEKAKLPDVQAEQVAAEEQKRPGMQESQAGRKAIEERERCALERQKRRQEIEAERAKAQERQRRLTLELKHTKDEAEEQKRQEMQAERAATEERKFAAQEESLQDLRAKEAAAERWGRIAAV
jgi:hypothetical protein